MLLGPHVIGSSRTALRLARNGYSAVAKLVSAYDRGAEYRAAGCYVIARHVPGPDDLWRSYIGRPETWYAEHVRPHLTHPANSAIQAWETGVNEDGPRKRSNSEAADPDDMRLRAEFETRVAQLIARDGKAPIIGNFGVGNPAGDRHEQRAAWRAYLSALRIVAAVDGIIGLHAYCSISGWEHPITTLLDVLRENKLQDTRIIITETGAEPGWKLPEGGISEERYAAMLIEQDRALRRLSKTIIGAAVFQFGDDSETWKAYNLEGANKLVDALIAYNNTMPPPQPPPPPLPPPQEKPLFDFPGAGQRMILYDAPGGRVVGDRFASWTVYVYETRGEWWRVTRGQRGWWIKVRFW